MFLGSHQLRMTLGTQFMGFLAPGSILPPFRLPKASGIFTDLFPNGIQDSSFLQLGRQRDFPLSSG
eukprot:CAMPEP_0116837022 /NCGR_PEP_ID=MMETSP0418-20121206/8425_1 /TAXON_ID=1158023 /ORGANISM="Astrosyne radiata, Strain 13vi08-1A" /LENGTH=65 /DNA_ID=CAMNT_0004466865 /DNA_START=239 /DNA_END=436 /DNA_ORIENTATION=-